MLYRGRDKKEFYLASLLYDSIEFRHLESVRSLLTEKGADPNLVLAKKGICPFHLVIGCDSHEFALKVTSLILQNGGNPNVRSDEGLTPVHIAAAWGKDDLLRLLLRNGGDPEARDINRKTPLHYATAEGFTECMDLLKSYLPEKILLPNQETDCNASDINSLVFDKIIVNNGYIVGEYATDNQPIPTSINADDGRLRSLPNTDATEYILSWFDQQQSVLSSTPTEGSVKRFGSITSLECSDSSLGESDGDRTNKRYDPRYITFRKVYRKTRKKSSSQNSPKSEKSVYSDAREASQKTEASNYEDVVGEFSQLKEYSKESGIITLPSSFKEVSVVSPTKRERSSDYQTCSQISVDLFEKNVFEITEDLTNIQMDGQNNEDDAAVSGQELSFVSVSEVYKYVDKDEGVVLYERRLLKSPSEHTKSVKSSIISSRTSTLPETLDYDTDTLRKELTQLGYSAGPITVTTKRVYLKKLYQLKKAPSQVHKDVKELPKKAVYSVELEKTLRNTSWSSDLTTFKTLEAELTRQFSNPDPSRKWREGTSKSSFTYLLLDPRVTNNLPSKADNLPSQKIWETFLSGIFYVGKGKRSRPYQHLYDAVELWKTQQSSSSKKLKRIVDIWRDDGGVICLHVFLNIIPVEAYTREAAMISALTLNNLTNVKGGEFYGVPATWPQKQKKMLGVYLLYKAMMIFLHEGERQLYPADIN